MPQVSEDAIPQVARFHLYHSLEQIYNSYGNFGTIWSATSMFVCNSNIQGGWIGRLCTIEKGDSEAISQSNYN